MASRFLAPLTATSAWLPDPLLQLQREIDRAFDDAFGGGPRSTGRQLMTAPRIDLQEADGELRLHADMPGVAPSELDLRVDGDVLTIRGERKSSSERNEQNHHVMERTQGRFQRSIQLPFAPDPQDVQAEIRDGVLEIRMPKRSPQERNRRIEVRDASSRSPASAAAGMGGNGSSSGSGNGSSNGSGNGSSMNGGSGGASSGASASGSGTPSSVGSSLGSGAGGGSDASSAAGSMSSGAGTGSSGAGTGSSAAGSQGGSGSESLSTESSGHGSDSSSDSGNDSDGTGSASGNAQRSSAGAGTVSDGANAG